MNLPAGDTVYCRSCNAQNRLLEYSLHGFSVWACSKCGLGISLMPTPADSTLASMAPMPDAVTWMNARDGAHSPAAESKELQNVNEVFAPASNGSSSSAEKAVEAEDKTTVQEVIVPDQAFHPAATSSIPKKPLESIPRTEKDMAARNDSSEATSIGPKPAQQIGASIRPPTVEKKVDPVLLMESLNSDDLDITKQSVVDKWHYFSDFHKR